ncbi:hypothetical protein [Scytonema hofmannii]|nr:hypothetical protein [Scytonema hofmannii]
MNRISLVVFAVFGDFGFWILDFRLAIGDWRLELGEVIVKI